MEMRQKLLVDNNIDNILFKEDVHMKECQVEGCSNKHYSKGYCRKHYRVFKKYGEIKRINRTPNEIVFYENYAEMVLYDKNCNEITRTLISLDDVEKVKKYKWRLNQKGYGITQEHKHSKIIRLHRYIMDCPENMVVDHINHNPLDNRRSNLRICTQQENSMNKSNVKGVTWESDRCKWRANICYKGKRINLGRYETKEEAIKARKEAEKIYFGEFANNEKD